MAGPIFRIIAQVAVTGINVVSRAFMQAYAEAARDGGKAASAAASAARQSARGVPLRDALAILNIESEAALSKELVLERYAHMFKANDPAVGGSLYLQAKVYHAKEALMDHLDVPFEQRDVDFEGGEGEEGEEGGEGEGGGEGEKNPEEEQDERAERR